MATHIMSLPSYLGADQHTNMTKVTLTHPHYSSSTTSPFVNMKATLILLISWVGLIVYGQPSIALGIGGPGKGLGVEKKLYLSRAEVGAGSFHEYRAKTINKN